MLTLRTKPAERNNANADAARLGKNVRATEVKLPSLESYASREEPWHDSGGSMC